MVTKTYKSLVGKINYHIGKNSVLNRNMTRWYVGITNDPSVRLNQHLCAYPNLQFFMSYYARTREIAHAIEVHFSERGTSNAPTIGGAKPNRWYVYVFKSDPTVLDRLIK